MVTITVLPPQDEPSKPTAQARVQSLGEHLRAFMNKNNASGFLTDKDMELGEDTVGGLLMSVMFGPGLYAKRVRRTAALLRKLSGGTLPNKLATTLVYRALGYESVKHAKLACGELHDDAFVPNVSDKSGIQKLYANPAEEALNDIRIHQVAQPPKPSKRMQKYLDRKPAVNTYELFPFQEELRQTAHGKFNWLDNVNPEQLAQAMLFRGDFTDSVHRVDLLDVSRPDGSQIEVCGFKKTLLDIRTNLYSVSLEDGDAFAYSIDSERASFALINAPEAEELTVALGVTTCNHNRPLQASEYFNRKLLLQQTLGGRDAR